MKYNEFYKFETKFVKSPITIKNNSLTFAELNKLSNGEYEGFQFPINFTVISGKKWMPVLNPPSVGLYILRKDVIEQLYKNQISGFTGFPIIIKEKDGKINNDYFGLSITGKTGKIDFKKSTVFERKTGNYFGKIYKGLFPEMQKWDGSDIFRPAGTLFVIISQKTKNIFEQFEISNLDITALKEVELMALMVENSL